MAGSLPGVECARRRRFHQSDSVVSSSLSSSSSSIAPLTSTRRSSFCLYTTSHESLPSNSSSTLLQRSLVWQANPDEKLAGAAREARERLDERLRAAQHISIREKRKEKANDTSTRGTSIARNSSEGELLKLQIEVYDGRKRRHGRSSNSSKRRFNWSKFSCIGMDMMEDCAVCLECFKLGDTLIHLPCAHRFHSTCLHPWLQNNAQCPCCRMNILI